MLLWCRAALNSSIEVGLVEGRGIMGVLDPGKEETNGTTSTVQGLLAKLLTHPQPSKACSATYGE
jgi:hypothetical protein